MFDKLRKLFTPKTTGLVCPRCEEALEGHDDAACARRMSRRYFFGVVGGGLVAAAAAPKIIEGLHTDGLADAMNAFCEQYIRPAVCVIADQIDLRITGGLFNPTSNVHAQWERDRVKISEYALRDMNSMIDRWAKDPLVWKS